MFKYNTRLYIDQSCNRKKLVSFSLLLYCLVLIITPSLLLADNSNEFNKKEWQKITENKDYSPKKIDIDPANQKPIDLEAVKTSVDIITQIIILLIVAAVIIGIIYFIHKSQLKAAANKKVKNTLEHLIEDPEENLPQSDIESLIKEAEASKDYRRLLRLYYLWIIQTMEIHKHIVWKKEKTNLHYVREVYNKNYQSDFRSITNDLQAFFYGEAVLDESEYELLKIRLLTLKQHIK